MVGPQIMPPAQTDNFRENGGQLGANYGRSCSRWVGMRMMGEHSSIMHVKWGDGGDLVSTVNIANSNDLGMFFYTLKCKLGDR